MHGSMRGGWRGISPDQPPTLPPLTPRQSFDTRYGTIMAVAEPLEEEEELAVAILRRIEAGEPLSAVLPAARRLAQMMGDDVEVGWLPLESFGIGSVPESAKPPEPAWTGAGRKFLRLHAVVDAEADPKTLPKAKMTHIANRPVKVLEQITPPRDPFSGGATLTKYGIDAWKTGTILYSESRRVVDRVRQEVHMYATDARQLARRMRRWLEIFGKDAPTVFVAGGPLLRELRNAAESLAQPGKGPTAASQARTALLTMGRELYHGSDQRTSPLTGETYKVRMEINKLHACLDQLWQNAPEDRKPSLAAAHSDVDIVYELGSRAKNPFAVTHEQAEQTVKSTFAVAHAITFAGGFPLPVPSAG